jgi:hypothetical protein
MSDCRKPSAQGAIMDLLEVGVVLLSLLQGGLMAIDE